MQKKAWLAVAGGIGGPAMATVLLLAGCATPPEPPAPGLDGQEDRIAPEGGRPEGGRGGGELNMFISPAGKPYRGRPGEPYPSAVWFAQVDTDHDGRISRDEFRADAEAFFRELDTDHNGVIDGFEIAAYEKAMPEILPRLRDLAPGEGMDLSLGRTDDRRGQGGGLGGGGSRGRRGAADGRQGAGLFGFLDQPEPITVADTDLDGHVTLAEARAAADRRFDILDKNADGYLTLTELPKTPVQAFAERREAQRLKRSGGKPPPKP